MPSVYVEISPNILKWVLEQADAELLDTSLFLCVQQWIVGSKKPTFNQIEQLSRKTRIPLGYFFLDNPPKEEIKLVDFRTVNSIELAKPSRELIDTISDMENVMEWMHEYRKETGFEECGVVGLIEEKKNPTHISNTIRDYLELEETWFLRTKGAMESFNLIRNKLNQIGVIVMMNGVVRNNTHRPLNVEEFRAFAMIDDYAPLIFINGADSEGARLFSLIHEMAHIFLGRNDLFNDRQREVNGLSDIEKLCNAITAEILVPNKEFFEEWSKNESENIFDKVFDLSKVFHCGMIVIARKALDNKKITSTEYNKISKEVIELYYKTKEKRESGGNFYNTLNSRVDKLLVLSLCEGLSEGRISYTDAFRLTNTNMKTFSELVTNLGGVSNW